MQLSDVTILITGGSSGIGLEMTRQLLKKNNRVIICGSSREKLEHAQNELPEIETYQCDLSQESECIALADWVRHHHSDLQVLVNNAATVHIEPFFTAIDVSQKAMQEMQVNFMAPVRLISELHPVISKNKHPAVINISTGLVYAPKVDYPFYNATKAALHSFTQVLRHQAKPRQLKVVEVLFPAVDTPWHKGQPPAIAISPEKAVGDMMKELEKGREEIKVGKVKLLYFLSRLAPALAFRVINKTK